MFKNSNKISLNHVRDTVYAVEGDEKLKLYVDEDAMMIARRIKRTLGDIESAKEDMGKLDKAALRFARAVFGVEQTEQLLNFYHGSTYAVFEFTSKYFTQRLTDKITKAQKHAKIV